MAKGGGILAGSAPELAHETGSTYSSSICALSSALSITGPTRSQRSRRAVPVNVTSSWPRRKLRETNASSLRARGGRPW